MKTLPEGTTIEVSIVDGVASNTSKIGDRFRATVSKDITADGMVVIPAGSTVNGEVTEAVPLGKIGGTAKLGLRFSGCETPSGERVQISSTYFAQGKSESKKDAATIGGAAAGGAVLGRLLSKNDKAKGTVLGALAGAAAGTAIAAKTKGQEIEIPPGTALQVKLERPVDVEIRR